MQRIHLVYIRPDIFSLFLEVDKLLAHRQLTQSIASDDVRISIYQRELPALDVSDSDKTYVLISRQ